jgi:hypothetical protein
MDTLQRNFHIEEYKQLKGEVATLLQSGQTLMRYAIVVSATVFAWLSVQGLGYNEALCLKLPGQILRWAWCIPAAFSVLGAIGAGVGSIRLWQMGAYLRTLETALGAPRLGWEFILKDKWSLFTGLGMSFWVGVVAINSVVAYVMWNEISAAPSCSS